MVKQGLCRCWNVVHLTRSSQGSDKVWGAQQDIARLWGSGPVP